MDNYTINREVNLRDISANVLNEWKKLLILIILLFLAMFSVGIKKEYSNKQAKEISTASNGLTEVQKNEVEELFAQYKVLYKQNKLYSARSTSLMNTLDPYNTPAVSIQFVVSVNISNPVMYYQNLNLTDDQKNQLADLSGLDDANSVTGLIYVSDGTDQVLESSNLITENNSKNVIMDVEMVGISQDDMAAASNILADAVGNETNALADAGYTIEVAEVSRGWNETFSPMVLKYQDNFDTQYDKIKSKFNDLKDPSSLVGDEKVYYQELISDFVKSEDETNASVFSAKLLLKSIGISIVLSIFLVYLIEGLKYLMSHTVKTAGDLILSGAGPVLGVAVPSEKKKYCFAKQIRNLSVPGVCAEETTIRLASLEIKNQLLDAHFKSLFVCCDLNDTDTKNAVELLCAPLKSSFSIYVGSPSNNVEDFNKFCECESVAFVTTAYSTPDHVLAKEVSMAKRTGKYFAGSILVKRVF